MNNMKYWVVFFGVLMVSVIIGVLYAAIYTPDHDEVKAEALSIYTNRPKNLEAFNTCLNNSNKNRDVVYNDSNEVVKSCEKYANKLYPINTYGTITWSNAVDRELNRLTNSENDGGNNVH